ncbi:hypothetical protein BDY19DRAFT_994013 [Irpex rosettiformis]|uniref:Uncharacterized protein n=1 Tax=Irpex rosettiformis TaxID=378272 RepID=A0ACB8U2Y4_9APHY|nr:hypothetical protein BDY19DRAFT_994013 [Irpex rosettiformis]
MSVALPPVTPGFDLQVGPILVLICLALMLYGTFCAQCYFYWMSYGEDRLRLRLYVLGLCLLESLHTAFCIHILYDYFVTHFGDPVNGVGHIVWSAGMCILAMTEGFYINRIFHLSGSWLVAAVPSILLFSRIVLSLVSAAYLYVYTTWESFREHPIPENCLTASLSLAVATDLSVTLLLVYYLRKRKTGFKSTNGIISTLMRHTVHNGAIAMFTSAMVVIMLHALPSSLMFAGFAEIISKLYANSIVASLNSRQEIVQKGSSGDHMHSIEMSRQVISRSVRVAHDRFTSHDTETSALDLQDKLEKHLSLPIVIDTTVETYSA